MSLQSIDLSVNPAEETIRLGPLAVRFLVTGENSAGTVAVFEMVIPAGQRLMAPAHSHDHYEETVYGIEGVLTWTVDGKRDRHGAGAGALHSAGRRSPVRQQRRRRCEGAVRGYARRDRPAVFPRNSRSGQRGSRWSARPREDDGDHAPPRADPGSASASGIGPRCVWKVGLPEFCVRDVLPAVLVSCNEAIAFRWEKQAQVLRLRSRERQMQEQPQVLRLRGPREAQPASLRMTTDIYRSG